MTEIRQATEDDVAELVRLRTLLFETLGGGFFNPATADEDWQVACASVLEEWLTVDNVRVLVIDGNSGLAACGIGAIERRLPGPHLRNGRLGHVIGVITDPVHRRRGHSRSIMQELLDWFTELEVARVDLYASPDGEPLYRALGFVDRPDPALYWRPTPGTFLTPPHLRRRGSATAF
jgi:ribosomal protein S18 acetylase RimI-like enzyme